MSVSIGPRALSVQDGVECPITHEQLRDGSSWSLVTSNNHTDNFDTVALAMAMLRISKNPLTNEKVPEKEVVSILTEALDILKDAPQHKLISSHLAALKRSPEQRKLREYLGEGTISSCEGLWASGIELSTEDYQWSLELALKSGNVLAAHALMDRGVTLSPEKTREIAERLAERKDVLERELLVSVHMVRRHLQLSCPFV